MKKKTAKIGLWITGDGRMMEKYTVKKWYDENAVYYKGEIFAIVDVRNQANKICDRLNELSTENEQLKQEYNKLEHRHSLLHDVCIEVECDRDSYHKDVLSLEKENEQLKDIIARMEINNEIVKIIKKHLPIGFVAGLEDKQIENTVKSILKELKEEELLK